MTLLDALSPYITIAESQRDKLDQIFTSIQFEKGDFIFQPGESSERLFFLTDGLVRCYYLNDDKEVNLRLLTDNSAVLPFASYITKQPSDEYIQSMSACMGYVLQLDTLTEKTFPSHTLNEIRRVLAERHYLSMERRLRMLQLKSAEQRYHYFCEEMEHRIVYETPAYHVASYLGITPESLSRVKRGRS